MAKEMRPVGKRGIYYANCRVKGPDGKSIKLDECLKTNDEVLAKRYLNDLKTLVERGEYRKHTKLFNDLVTEYKTNPEKFPSKSKSNQERIEGILETHLIPFFGNKRIDQIERLPGNEENDSVSIVRYKQKREKAGAKPSTLVKELRVIRDILRMFDPSWKLPTAGDTKDMEFQNKPKEVEEFLEETQIYKILEHIPEKYRKLCKISAYTGFRLGDACYLKQSDIDYKNGWIKIVQRKTGHKVKVPIHPKLKAVLNSIPTPIRRDKRLFPDCKPKATSTAFRRACARAGMVGFHFHDLRHFAGSHLINNGMPIFKVSKFLGHRNVKTTEIYTHINDESLEEVGEAFGSESAVALEPAVVKL